MDEVEYNASGNSVRLVLLRGAASQRPRSRWIAPSPRAAPPRPRSRRRHEVLEEFRRFTTAMSGSGSRMRRGGLGTRGGRHGSFLRARQPRRVGGPGRPRGRDLPGSGGDRGRGGPSSSRRSSPAPLARPGGPVPGRRARGALRGDHAPLLDQRDPRLGDLARGRRQHHPRRGGGARWVRSAPRSGSTTPPRTRSSSSPPSAEDGQSDPIVGEDPTRSPRASSGSGPPRSWTRRGVPARTGEHAQEPAPFLSVP
jgi:hypothetical protein